MLFNSNNAALGAIGAYQETVLEHSLLSQEASMSDAEQEAPRLSDLPSKFPYDLNFTGPFRLLDLP
jgi:hypothetical protein